MSIKSKLLKATLPLTLFVRTLIDDIKGFAAVEFAMIVPVMIIMLLGSVEVSEALTVDGRINIVADSVSDMVARSQTVTANNLRDLMRISDSLMGKYPTEGLKVEVVSLVADPATGVVTVDWSYNSGGSRPYVQGSNYPGVWTGMVSGGNSLIVAKAKYDYTSPIGQYIHGVIKLSHTASYESRQGKVVGPP